MQSCKTMEFFDRKAQNGQMQSCKVLKCMTANHQISKISQPQPQNCMTPNPKKLKAVNSPANTVKIKLLR